jgi:hypothetical protein
MWDIHNRSEQTGTVENLVCEISPIRIRVLGMWACAKLGLFQRFCNAQTRLGDSRRRVLV